LTIFACTTITRSIMINFEYTHTFPAGPAIILLWYNPELRIFERGCYWDPDASKDEGRDFNGVEWVEVRKAVGQAIRDAGGWENFVRDVFIRY
jgi:hypothetical protein